MPKLKNATLPLSVIGIALTLLSPLSFSKETNDTAEQSLSIDTQQVAPQGADIKELLKKYQIVIEDHPDDVNALLKLGYLYNELERYQRSFESYDKVVKLEPENRKAWLNRGYALSQIDRLDDALASYDKVIELDPNDIYVWFNRGNLLSDMNQLEKALSSYERSLKIDSNNPDAWYNKGLVLEQLNRNKEALASYKQAQKQLPGSLTFAARVIYMENKIQKMKSK